MNPDKRILIADDHPIFRQGLRGVIETNSDLQVAGEASDGETALAGQHYLSPAAASLAVQRRAISQQPKPSSLGELTPAERSILRLLAEYKTSSQIGQELFISPRTVDNHRANICRKLGLNGRHALLKFALQHQAELAERD